MTCSDRTPGSRTRGFTLIEVIVAMLIATMVVTVVFSGLGVAFDAWSATTARIDELETERFVRGALRRQIEGALPLSTVVEDGLTRTPVIGFEGTPDSVRFVSNSTFSIGPNGPARWVEWQTGDDGLRVREYDIVPPDNRPGDEPVWEAVLRIPDSSAIRFEYRRPRSTFDPLEFPGEWVSDWAPDASARLGAAIPIAIRVAAEGNIEPERPPWAVIRLKYARSALAGMRVE